MASTESIERFLGETQNVMVAGVRCDGRLHLTPTWFSWDGGRFDVSTTRSRVKDAILRRDPRAQLAVDDSTGFRAVLVSATAEVRGDVSAELRDFRAIREKHGVAVSAEAEQPRALMDEGRVLVAFTPDGPPPRWTAVGLD